MVSSEAAGCRRSRPGPVRSLRSRMSKAVGRRCWWRHRLQQRDRTEAITCLASESSTGMRGIYSRGAGPGSPVDHGRTALVPGRICSRLVRHRRTCPLGFRAAFAPWARPARRPRSRAHRRAGLHGTRIADGTAGRGLE